MSLHDRSWIWNSQWKESPSETSAGGFVHFRRQVDLAECPSQPIFISITADTRYKIYINSTFVNYGPVKGDSQAWYFDDLDIQPYLKTGRNIFTVRVLRLYYGTRFGTSFPRMPQGGLRIQHSRDLNDPPIDFSIETSESWETAVDTSSILPILEDDMFLHIFEAVDMRNSGAMQWIPATPHKVFTAFGYLSPWHLVPRQIPFQKLRPAAFSAIHNVRSSQSAVGESEWRNCLLGTAGQAHPIKLPAGTRHHVEIEASHHLTAFLSLTFTRPHTAGSVIKITYSECYEDTLDSPHFLRKGDRRDTSKKLFGPYDTFQFRGVDVEQDGSTAAYRRAEDNLEVFTPFHFRTFRFVALDIEVAEESDLILHGVDVTRTNYPLDVKAHISTDGVDQGLPVQRLWDTSVLTLENCMHDCYEDCPFYEQLQYAMDTRSSALFTYYLSGDDRLARQAIVQIRNSFQPALGLTASRAPCEHLQIIPNFSLFWICMVVDHFQRYGDMAFTSEFLPICDAVLDSFKRRVHPELGLVRCYETDDFWDFVDWTEAWKPRGIPPAGKRTGFQTFSSSLYAYTLQQIAPVLQSAGREGLSNEYTERSASLISSLRQRCFDGEFFTDGLATDAPLSEYSQHNQVWAILSGAITGADAQNLLRNALSNQEFTTPSIAMSFYTLRALSLVGGDLYDTHFHDFWTPWTDQLANNVTTWVEDNVSQRSDCHAWGSAPIYEFTAEVAGLTPLTPGWRSISFKPRLGLFKTMDSKVPIPMKGTTEMAIAHVRWERKNMDVVSLSLDVKKPSGEVFDVPVILKLPGVEEELVMSSFSRELLSVELKRIM
ncbi:Six-hairpin glycosidase-like protein [Leptodontidium sp. MPI-SDFR-AT-0119]|nr:Six-hairpin glycosidase-like protein [Leptodontidium sp. MPI-SDFR-AT-0119]